MGAGAFRRIPVVFARSSQIPVIVSWIPAFAGMTNSEVSEIIFRRKNDF
jgi:hypothetical protein